MGPEGRRLLAARNNEGWRVWDLRGANGAAPLLDIGSTGVSLVQSSGADQSIMNIAKAAGAFMAGRPVFVERVFEPALSPDGRWLAIYRHVPQYRRMEVSLWDLEASPPRSSNSHYEITSGYSTGQNKLAFSANGRWLATNMAGVRVWPIAEDGTLGEPEVLDDRSTGGNQDMALSPDGRYVAWSENRAVHLFDRNAEDDVTRRRQLHGHEQTVERLVFSSDGTWLVSASQNGELRLWDLRDEELQDTMIALTVQNHGASQHLGLEEIRFSPDTRWLAASTANGIYFWQLEPANLLDEARRLAGREMTGDELVRYRLNTPERLRERLLRQAAQVTKQLEESPQNAALLRRRADLYVFAGELRAAIDDLRLAARLQPDDIWAPYYLPVLLAQTDQAEEYRRACEEFARRWGNPPAANLEMLERVAKASLFWSESGADWKSVAMYADRAVTRAAADRHWVLPWAQIAKGLAEYRLGNYTAALEWAEKSLASKLTDYSIIVPGNALKAMAQARLGQAAEARDSLTKARLIQGNVPTPLHRIVAWHDWYMHEFMIREAEAALAVERASEATAAVAAGAKVSVRRP
jgi:tetratricopeptide (TPR) repeat protein